jgi:hypothetical protein
MTELSVQWCDVRAARFACQRWHYSHTLPVGRLATFGVWEDERFIGAVVFGRGANYHLGDAFGLMIGQYVELNRIALHTHEHPVSMIGARALRALHEHAPELRLVISYADPRQGHTGGIYQAMNWRYLGQSAPSRHFVMPDGSVVHQRAATAGNFNGPRVPAPPGGVLRVIDGKHKYAVGFDRAMKRKLAAMAKPYPCGGRLKGEPADFRSEGAGSIPAHRSTK